MLYKQTWAYHLGAGGLTVFRMHLTPWAPTNHSLPNFPENVRQKPDDMYSKTPDVYFKPPELYQKNPQNAPPPGMYQKNPKMYQQTPKNIPQTPPYHPPNCATPAPPRTIGEGFWYLSRGGGYILRQNEGVMGTKWGGGVWYTPISDSLPW